MSEKHFNIVLVAQSGRLQFEAVLFLASLRAHSPNFQGKVFVAEPQPNACWERNPKINSSDCRQALLDMGAVIYPVETIILVRPIPTETKLNV